MGGRLAPAQDHTVVPGDSMASLAKQYGFTWEQLWEHPKNQELAKLRENPNTLMTGDVVFIPDIEPKTVDVPVELHFDAAVIVGVDRLVSRAHDARSRSLVA